jgi:uncharacterized membrane protein YjfL (UPF0719 family)
MDNPIEAAANGLTMEAFLATLLYSATGIIILILTVLLINAVFRLNLHRELVKEHNTAFGIVIAGMAIAIAIIISGTITG